jgi:hypothetical protein
MLKLICVGLVLSLFALYSAGLAQEGGVPAPVASPQPSAAAAFAGASASRRPEGPASKYVNKLEPVPIPKIGSAPVIDGLLNDPIWQDAPVFGDFVQTQPGDNIAPKHPMEFKMAYDSKHVYFASM